MLDRRTGLGTYDTAVLAACAYDVAARQLQGAKARPNFDEKAKQEQCDQVRARVESRLLQRKVRKRRRRLRVGGCSGGLPPLPAPACTGLHRPA